MSPSVSVNDINVMTHRFAVKWSISTRDLNTKSSNGEISSHTLRSNRYRFPSIKNLDFSYILFCGEDYKIRVECVVDMPLFLEDVLVLVKDRILRVECSPTNTIGKQLFYPAVLEENSFQDNEVTFHCIMMIPTQVKAVISDPKEDYLGRKTVECESIVTHPDTKLGFDAVDEFRYNSRFPDFNVEMAIHMMGEAHKRGEPMLKSLCSDYLVQNLTAQNVTEVLKQAAQSDAKDLSQKCVEFLSKKCKVEYKVV